MGDTAFRLGGVTFRIVYSGGAHAPDDLLLHVVEERVVFAGDLLFAGRLPFVGNADSKGWLKAWKR
jgi:glyoxylase-like metal-dependent hydrolase (beta-lactamase superfamily II)